MTQIEKLEKVIKEWEQKGEAIFQEAAIARKHNYKLEATLLDEKYILIRDFCMEVRLKVIEQLITVS
jgi:hypothetical protein